jgi:hypothetical protein
MAELGAFFGNPNIQRQGARARALAGQRDVNTLPDPLTYAVMQGLLGTRPDEMGFSVLNPDYEKIKKVAEPAFALGLLGQAAPALAPLTKGLPVGASVKNVGTKLRVKPPTDDVYEVMDATFEFAKLGGNKTLPIDQLTGGVRMTDPKEVKRVKELAEKISSPDGFVSRIIVDDLGNVLEGQHRLEALRLLGEKNVPVSVIEDLSNKYDIAAMKKALEGKFRSDETRQLLKHSIDTLEEAGSIDKALSDFAMPARYQKPFEDAIKASKVKASYPQQEALDTAQRNAALPIEEGGLGLPKDNTPEMRAEAMGYDVPAYHGTTVWEAEDGRKLGDIEAFNRLASTEIVGRKPSIDQVGIFASDRPDQLGAGMYSGSQGAIYPLMLRMENPKSTSFEQMARTASNLSSGEPLGAGVVPRVSDVEPYRQMLKEQGFDSLIIKAKQGSPYTEFKDQTGYVLLDPSQIRSRNAAFDPRRRNEADILAGLLPLSLLDEEKRKEIQSLLD